MTLPRRSTAALLTAFALIGQDVVRNKIRGKAVISCSITTATLTDEGINKMNRVLKTLKTLDIPIIVSAGSYGEEAGRGEIDTYPPLLADQHSLIIVGAVAKGGSIAAFSQGGPMLTTAAGGVDVACATDEGDGAFRLKQGTSFAAPLVAGVVAYWLSHPDYAGAFPAGQVAEAAKASITELQWARIEGGYKVAYNGANMEPCAGAGAASESAAFQLRRGLLEGRQSTVGLGAYFANFPC